jgi:hypothetical protein
LGGCTADARRCSLPATGAELVALRGARQLLQEQRIRRILIEVDSMMRWRLNVRGKPKIDKTLEEVINIFEGWRCFNVCDRSPYTFPRHFVWGGASGCSNVFCLAPGVDEHASNIHTHALPTASCE